MPPPPTVALVTLATRRYFEFAAPLVASARRHFLGDCVVTPIVLTDRTDPIDAEVHRIAHAAWPAVTLNKFGTLARFRPRLSAFDYVFLCDADMRFVGAVGREILGDLVAVHHPVFFDRPAAEFTYERRPESRAGIPPGHGRRYYCGGFAGGRATRFLQACTAIQAGVDADTARGLVALWHDESHWNRYLLDHPPAVELSPGYCYPEEGALPFTPRLLALQKDHVAIRHGPLRATAARAWRWCRRAARTAVHAVRRTAR